MKKRALVSVSDKTGIVEFCKRLIGCGYEIISTGGTAKALEKAPFDADAPLFSSKSSLFVATATDFSSVVYYSLRSFTRRNLS